MLLNRVEDTAQAVDVLLRRVDAKVEPCVAFYRDIRRNSLQGEQLLAAELLQHLLLFSKFVVHLAQSACALVLQTVDNIVELVDGEACHETLCTRYVLHEQVEHNLGVAGAHHQAEHILLLALFLLACILAVALDEQHNYEHHEQNLSEYAAVEHYQADKGAGSEGYGCGDEPTADYADYTSHTEYGTLAAPSAVGE